MTDVVTATSDNKSTILAIAVDAKPASTGAIDVNRSGRPCGSDRTKQRATLVSHRPDDVQLVELFDGTIPLFLAGFHRESIELRGSASPRAGKA